MTRKQLSEKISGIAPGKTSDWEKCSKTHLVKVYGWVKGINRIAKREAASELGDDIPIVMSKDDILRAAKELELFEKNKKYSRYEICIPIGEYREM